LKACDKLGNKRSGEFVGAVFEIWNYQNQVQLRDGEIEGRMRLLRARFM